MRMVTTTHKFCQDCTKYNNLLAMAATKRYATTATILELQTEVQVFIV